MSICITSKENITDQILVNNCKPSVLNGFSPCDFLKDKLIKSLLVTNI